MNGTVTQMACYCAEMRYEGILVHSDVCTTRLVCRTPKIDGILT